MPYCIIDADYMIYAAGFAVEDVCYIVRAKLANGDFVEDVVDSKEAADAWQSGRAWPLGTTFSTPYRLVEAEPVSHAKLILRNIIKKIQRRADTHFGGLGQPPPRTVLYLTGSTNFRNELATIKRYKGNRDALHKPVHYEALREYLMKLGAVMTTNCEADDACATLMAIHNYDPELVMLAAVDKDLWTVPGLHYNFMKDEWSDVTPQQALVNFYRQLITGDTVDNIGGCYRRGETFAVAHITEDMTEQEMYQVCLDAYSESVVKTGCPYAHLEPLDALLENARLLHMRRSTNDVWVPPALRQGAASSGPSCGILMIEESTTTMSPEHFGSSSRSPDSSAKSAGPRSRAKRATRQTSKSGATKSGSKRKASSLPTTNAGS